MCSIWKCLNVVPPVVVSKKDYVADSNAHQYTYKKKHYTKILPQDKRATGFSTVLAACVCWQNVVSKTIPRLKRWSYQIWKKCPPQKMGALVYFIISGPV